MPVDSNVDKEVDTVDVSTENTPQMMQTNPNPQNPYTCELNNIQLSASEYYISQDDIFDDCIIETTHATYADESNDNISSLNQGSVVQSIMELPKLRAIPLITKSSVLTSSSANCVSIDATAEPEISDEIEQLH